METLRSAQGDITEVLSECLNQRKKEGRRNANHDDPESMDPEHSSKQRVCVDLQAMLGRYASFSSFVGDCFV